MKKLMKDKYNISYEYFFSYNNCPFKVESILTFDKSYLVSSDNSHAPMGWFKKGLYKLGIYNNIFYNCMFLSLTNVSKLTKDVSK